MLCEYKLDFTHLKYSSSVDVYRSTMWEKIVQNKVYFLIKDYSCSVTAGSSLIYTYNIHEFYLDWHL